MNDAILTQVDPALSGPPHPKAQPASDEYARFCLRCGAQFIEKCAPGKRFSYCRTHRTPTQRVLRSLVKNGKALVRHLKKEDTSVLARTGDGDALAPVGNVAIKRICANELCKAPFIARHESAIYCGLVCYVELHCHHKTIGGRKR